MCIRDRLDDEHKVNFGDSNDLEIWHSSNNNSYIKNSTGELKVASDNIALLNTDQSKSHIQCNSGGAVELYYNNSKKFETNNEGVKVDGFLEMLDNQRIQMGNSDDLQIYHNGTDSLITDTGTGSLALGGSAVFIQNAAHNANMASFVAGGAANLFYNGSKKFETTATGTRTSGSMIVDGDIDPYSNNNNDLGSSANRWRNIYTNDLHLSNEGSCNDVDQTWGDWTIQEGESDLFLKNNRSGKKYKFNLTEVS